MKTNNENKIGKTNKKVSSNGNGNGNGKLTQVNTRRNNSLQGPIVVRKQKAQLEPAEPTGKNIIIADTNVYLDDHKAIGILCNGGNLLTFPATVTDELDSKKNDLRCGYEARETLREIDRLQEMGCENVVEESGMIFSKLNLKPDKADHQIVACLNYVLYHFAKGHEPYVGYDKVKFVTNDRGIKVVARRIQNKKDLVIEMYKKNRADIKKKDLQIPMFFIPKDKVAGDWSRQVTFPANGLAKKIPDGSPIIGYTDKKNVKKGEFVAIRRGDNFEIVNPNIQSLGIKPKSQTDCRHNWEQAASLYYLLNQDFDCVFLQGGAGSGKTLLAMAAALEQKRKGLFDKIMIFRVPAPVDPKKTVGLLPGDAGAKIGLYLRPIQQALLKLLKGDKMLIKLEREEISHADSKAEKKGKQNSQTTSASKKTSNLEVHVDDIFEQNGIEIAILEFARGENIDYTNIIVDDAQNLSEHETKTMLTRVGEGSKIVFTGDLGQIDSMYLDKYTSGLAHAIKQIGDDIKIGVVTLVQTLRSRLASLVEEKWNSK